MVLCCRMAGFGQTAIVGQVLDAISRQPLESASISLYGDQTVNTFTDHYGRFYLKARGANPVLLVSYVGYLQRTISVSGKDALRIELQPAAVNLKDAVVLQSGGATRFSTLSKIDLDLQPVKNTQELMRLAPGLFIAQHAGGGKAEQIFLRGFDCDHGTDVQVSVDGMPVNMVSHAHGQGYADTHFIIPETVNSIDFGAGPYYTEHGNLNTAGYVSFSTYNSLPQSRVQVEAGLFNSYRVLAMVDLLKKNKDKQSAYIAAEANYTDGPSLSPQHFNRFNLFGKYNFALSEHDQLTASVSAFKSKWDASGQVPTRALESGLISRWGSIDPSEGGNTERYNANISFVHRWSSQTSWENQAFYSRYLFNLYSDFSFFLSDSVNGDEINQRERRNMLGYNSRLTHKSYVGDALFTSNFGAGIRYDATDNTELAHVVKRRFLSDVKLGDIRESNLFAYAEQQASVGNWHFIAGLRFDALHFSYIDQLDPQMPAQGKAIFSPKLNIQYTVNPRVQLYVKAGKGFHSNDTRVVVAQQGQEILPAAYGADLGITLKPGSRWLLNIAAWYLQLEQEFVYRGDDAVVEPSGKTRREGLDLIARYQFTTNLFANLNFNLTRPRALGEQKGQDYIPLAPVATSTGGLFYKARKGFNGSFSYRYMKNRPANEDNSIVAKGYFVADGAINYTQPKYEIGLAFENLFNTKWNEAQFATESRLKGEPAPVTELNFTPGIPFFARVKLAVNF